MYDSKVSTEWGAIHPGTESEKYRDYWACAKFAGLTDYKNPGTANLRGARLVLAKTRLRQAAGHASADNIDNRRTATETVG